MPGAKSGYQVCIILLFGLYNFCCCCMGMPVRPAQGMQRLNATRSNLQGTSRVSPVFYSNSECIASATEPLLKSPAVTCPCFLRYIIGSDEPTTWDVFLVPKASYDVWKAKRYIGDPENIVEDYSTRKASTTGPNSFIHTPDINAFISGDHHLVARTNTEEKRCFNDASLNGISTEVVFESMPKACDLKSEEVVPKIVGGTAVDKDNTPDEMKYMALISSEEGPVCGGVHVGDGYVLTAAHCEIGSHPEAYNVRIGVLKAEDGTALTISRVFTHPDYHQLATHEALYDIALLEIRDLDASQKNDILAWNDNASIPAAGEIVTTAGFGYISEGWSSRPAPNQLLRVDIPVVSRRKCRNNFENVDGDLHLCAGYDEGGCDSCQADSGGPLRYVQTFENGSRRQVLVGIVSFGSGCARSERPGVYTRVSTFANWIEETLTYAKETRVGAGFWKSAVGVTVMVGGSVVVVVVLFAGVILACRSRGRSGQGEIGEGSDVPSTSGISR